MLLIVYLSQWLSKHRGKLSQETRLRKPGSISSKKKKNVFNFCFYFRELRYYLTRSIKKKTIKIGPEINRYDTVYIIKLSLSDQLVCVNS